MTIVVPSLAHYSESLYRYLLEYDLSIKFIGGDSYLGISNANINSKNVHFLKVKKRTFLGHEFFFFKKLFSYIRYEKKCIVLSGVDFHLLQYILIFFYCKIKKIKIIWWSHGVIEKQGRIGKFLRILFYKYATKVLLYSDQGEKNLISYGIKSTKCKVVRNCLHEKDYGFLVYGEEKIINKTNNNTLNILFSGRLNKGKRIDLLLNQIVYFKENNIKHFHLDIIGDGEMMDFVKTFVKENQLYEYVALHGALFGVEAHSLFLRADIMVIPGAVGLSIVHAFSFGIPIITNNDLENHNPEIELLNDGITGSFYDSGKTFSLAESIQSWHSRKDWQLVRANCIDAVIKLEYIPKKMAEKFYNSIIE